VTKVITILSALIVAMFVLTVVAAIAYAKAVKCPSASPVVCLGTKGNDTLKGSETADAIRGLGGDDTIKSYGSPDVINGGGGRDTITLGKQEDMTYGGKGNDWVFARDNSRDSITCNEGAKDVVFVDRKDAIHKSCETKRFPK
jgi:hypothetical protein